jgi:hypothetical protein
MEKRNALKLWLLILSVVAVIVTLYDHSKIFIHLHRCVKFTESFVK